MALQKKMSDYREETGLGKQQGLAGLRDMNTPYPTDFSNEDGGAEAYLDSYMEGLHFTDLDEQGRRRDNRGEIIRNRKSRFNGKTRGEVMKMGKAEYFALPPDQQARFKSTTAKAPQPAATVPVSSSAQTTKTASPAPSTVLPVPTGSKYPDVYRQAAVNSATKVPLRTPPMVPVNKSGGQFPAFIQPKGSKYPDVYKQSPLAPPASGAGGGAGNASGLPVQSPASPAAMAVAPDPAMLAQGLQMQQRGLISQSPTTRQFQSGATITQQQPGAKQSAVLQSPYGAGGVTFAPPGTRPAGDANLRALTAGIRANQSRGLPPPATPPTVASAPAASPTIAERVARLDGVMQAAGAAVPFKPTVGLPPPAKMPRGSVVPSSVAPIAKTGVIPKAPALPMGPPQISDEEQQGNLKTANTIRGRPLAGAPSLMPSTPRVNLAMPGPLSPPSGRLASSGPLTQSTGRLASSGPLTPTTPDKRLASK